MSRLDQLIDESTSSGTASSRLDSLIDNALSGGASSTKPQAQSDLPKKSDVAQSINSATNYLSGLASMTPEPVKRFASDAMTGVFAAGAAPFQVLDKVVSMPFNRIMSVVEGNPKPFGQAPETLDQIAARVKADNPIDPRVSRQTLADMQRGDLPFAMDPVKFEAARDAQMDGAKPGKSRIDQAAARVVAQDKPMLDVLRGMTGKPNPQVVPVKPINEAIQGYEPKSYEEDKQFAIDHPYLADLMNNSSKVDGLIAAISQANPNDLTGLGAMLRDHAAKIAARTPKITDKKLDELNEGEFGEWFSHQIAANSVDALQSLAGMVNPAAAQFVIGQAAASQYGSSLNEYRNMGLPENLAQTAAFGKGAFEGLTETMGIDVAKKAINLYRTMSPVAKKSIVKRAVGLLGVGTAVAGQEGVIEEGLNQVLGNGLDIATGYAAEGKAPEGTVKKLLNTGLFTGVPDAMVKGVAGGLSASGPAMVHAATAPAIPVPGNPGSVAPTSQAPSQAPSQPPSQPPSQAPTDNEFTNFLAAEQQDIAGRRVDMAEQQAAQQQQAIEQRMASDIESTDARVAGAKARQDAEQRMADIDTAMNAVEPLAAFAVIRSAKNLPVLPEDVATIKRRMGQAETFQQDYAPIQEQALPDEGMSTIVPEKVTTAQPKPTSDRMAKAMKLIGRGMRVNAAGTHIVDKNGAKFMALREGEANQIQEAINGPAIGLPESRGGRSDQQAGSGITVAGRAQEPVEGSPEAPQVGTPQNDVVGNPQGGNGVSVNEFDVTGRTDEQLANLVKAGKPGWREAAIAEVERRKGVSSAAQPEQMAAQASQAQGEEGSPSEQTVATPVQPNQTEEANGLQVQGQKAPQEVTPKKTRLKPMDDPRIKSMADDLRALANQTGWAQVGGRLLRKTEDYNSLDYTEIVGRTKWIPHAEWFGGMATKLSGKAATDAVEKAIAGQPMTAVEKRFVSELADIAQEQDDERLADKQAMEEAHAEAMAEREAIMAEAELAGIETPEDDLDRILDAAFSGTPGAFSDDEIFGTLNEGQEIPGPAETAEPQGPDEGAGQRGEEAGQVAGQAFSLTGQTPEEVRAEEQARADREKAEKEAADKAESEAKAKRIAKEVESRQRESAENFQLGQSAEDALAGQGDILSQPAKHETPSVLDAPVDKLQKRLDGLIEKRDKLHESHMQKYRDGSATRAQTTTHNARISDLNEQIKELRDAIKAAATTQSKPTKESKPAVQVSRKDEAYSDKGTPVPGETSRLSRRDTTKEDKPSLIIQHNLTAQNLLHAVKMGGIPVPSMAITKKDAPLTNFGEITLLGSKEMADPRGYANTRVFGADIYSPRYPSVEFQFTPNMQKRVEAILKDGISATDSTRLDWDEISRRGPEAMARSTPFMWKVLKDNGIEPDVKRTTPEPLPPELVPFVEAENFGPFDAPNDPAFADAVYTYWTGVLTQEYDGDRTAAEAEIAQNRARAAERGVDYFVRDWARKVNQYHMDSARAGAVDARATLYALEGQIREQGLQDDAMQAAEELFAEIGPNERISQGYTDSGNRRYVPHTLENVVKILKKELRGGENFNYGVGTIRSKFTPQFKSIKAIREAKDRLMDSAAFEKVKKEIDKEFSTLTARLETYHPASDRFGFGDPVSSALYDAATMGLSRALRENGFKDVPEETQQEVREFLAKLKDLPTEYFEAKILRDVDLSEFSAAVVPEGVNPKVVEALKARGVNNIRTYKKGERGKVISEFADELQKNGDEVLFSRSPGAGIPLRDAQAVVDVFKSVNRNAPEIILVDEGMNNLPDDLLMGIIALGDDAAVEGAYHNGKIYLFPQNLSSQERAAEVLAHEGRHFAFSAVRGRDMNSILLDIYHTNDHVRAAAKRKQKELGIESIAIATEEALADMTLDELRKVGGWKRLVAHVKNALRSFVAALRRAGLVKAADAVQSRVDGWTDADVAAMLRNADQFVRSGSGGGSGRTMLQRVWHGTPHIWAPEPGFPHGRPRLDKMGTGEGAQAFGWGFYTAQAMGVAVDYQRKLSDSKLMLDGVEVGKGRDVAGLAKTALGWRDGNIKATKDMLAEYAEAPSADAKTYRDTLAWIEENENGLVYDRGHLYQLDIPDDVLPYLLDWDKPLSEQTPEVRKAIVGDKKIISAMEKRMAKENSVRKATGLPRTNIDIQTGVEIYRAMGDFVNSDEAASEYLASIGIVGNRYLDGQSRKDGEGSYNYVIWDQPTLDKIAMLERNGEKLDAMRDADTADTTNPDIRFSRATPARDQYTERNKRFREEHITYAQKAKTWLKRNFTPGGLLPESTFNAKISRDAEMEAVEFRIGHMIASLERAIKMEYGVHSEKLDAQVTQLLADAMAGTIDPSVPDMTKTALAGMRQYIDNMSTRFVDMLYEDADRMYQESAQLREEQRQLSEDRNNEQDEAKKEKMLKRIRQLVAKANALEADGDKALLRAETITSNMGEYVHRSYRAFDDAKWFEKIDDETLNNARDYLIIRYLDEGMDEQEAENRAEVVINEIVKHGTAYESFEGFIKESKLGAKDLSVMKHREQIAPEIRALMGEYKDPRINFAKSVTKMSRLIFNQQFLNKIREDGMGVYLFTDENKPPEATVQLAGDGSEVYAPLNGLWVTPEVNQGFVDAMGREVMADWYRAVVRVNGMVKFGKTVMSPTTALRNWYSAWFFTLANGHFDLTQLKQSVSGIKEYFGHASNQEKLDYLEELKRRGVVYDTPYAGEMMRLLKEASVDDLLLNGWMKNAKKPIDFAQRFYQYGDDFWKIMGYENEWRMLVKAGMDEEAAKTEAAKRIRDTYPTYSMVGRGINWLRRFPLVGTFVSFPAEIIRTSVNIVKYLHDDIKNPDMPKEIVARRVAGLAIASGWTYAMAALSAALLGMDDEDEEALRIMAAPWSRNANLLYLGYDEDGKAIYMDLSFLDPYSYWKKPINAVMRGRPLEDSMKDMVSEAATPFFGMDILAGSILEVLTNKKESGGPVYKEYDHAWNQFLGIAQHIGGTVQPGILANMERTAMALAGVTKKSGQTYDLKDEVAAWFGFRWSTINPKTSLYYGAYEFSDAKREAEKHLRDAISNPNTVDDDDLRDAYDMTVRLRAEAFGRLSLIADAAKKGGMTDSQVIDALRNGGASERDAYAVASGQVPEYRMPYDSFSRLRERVQKTHGNEAAKRADERYRAVLSY